MYLDSLTKAQSQAADGGKTFGLRLPASGGLSPSEGDLDAVQLAGDLAARLRAFALLLADSLRSPRSAVPTTGTNEAAATLPSHGTSGSAYRPYLSLSR